MRPILRLVASPQGSPVARPYAKVRSSRISGGPRSRSSKHQTEKGQLGSNYQWRQLAQMPFPRIRCSDDGIIYITRTDSSSSTINAVQFAESFVQISITLFPVRSDSTCHSSRSIGIRFIEFISSNSGVRRQQGQRRRCLWYCREEGAIIVHCLTI